jgi:hypothetical protein
MRTRSTPLALALTLAAVAAAPASGQEASVDTRWQAFLGCWEPLVEDGMPAADHTLCFRPAANGAVSVVTVTGAEVQERETIRADGIDHPIADEACTGTETGRWSEDGARVYLRSSLQCGADVLGREMASVVALAGGGTMIDVQAVGVDEQYGVRVREYRSLAAAEYPASERELARFADDATRLYAAAPLTLDDIIEATRVVPTAAVQAMLVHLPTTRLHVDADALVALSDAGVSDDVIDVIVALAHPDKFAVATEPIADESDEGRSGQHVWLSNDYYDPYYSRYSRYGRYGYDPYYSRYGYGYGHGYGYPWGSPGTIIIVDRDDDDDTAEPTRRGVLVKGRGYTRTGDRSGSDPQARQPRTTAPRPSVDRSSGTSSGSASTSSRGSSSSSGSSRKAQPRNPPTH